MQEAFGGMSLLKMFMIFFVIYVCFIAIALNFAKIYRVKNYVINTLEQGQFSGTMTSANDLKILQQLDNYFSGVPYRTVVTEETCKKYGDNPIVYNGVCIIPKGDEKARYYKVVVFLQAEFPFLNFNMTIPASGETKVIVS